jgi:hypothetical protein
MKKPKHQSKTKFNKKSWLYIVVGFFVVLIAWFISIQPSNSREWEKDFAVLPQVSVEGETVTINNVRDWRHTETETISNEYIQRTVNINDLERVWFLVEPFGKWAGVAHTYFVFDFKDQDPLSFSIEARREKGEVYTAQEGLLKKFEMIYMWGTEKDFTIKRVVQLKNNVYMYPMTITPEFQKKLFLELAMATHDLETKPRFYNTVTSNCTNNLAYHANNIQKGAAPFHYARFLTGYSAEYLYGMGYIPHDKPFEEIKSQYRINDIVAKNYQQENFSALLRNELIH